MAAKKKAKRKTQRKFLCRVRSQSGAVQELKGVTLNRVISEAADQFLKFEHTPHPLIRILVYFRETPVGDETKGSLLVLKGVRSAQEIAPVYEQDIVRRGTEDDNTIIELHPMWDYRPPKTVRDAVVSALKN